MRAELIAQWVEQFARPEDFCALAVEADGRLAVALPLVRRKLGRLLDVAALPCNEWSSSGDLLLDPQAGDDALDVLAAAIGEMPWHALWLDETWLDAPRWQRFRAALDRAGMAANSRSRWQVGRVAIDGDWSAYQSTWSRKHRQKMAWALRRLKRCGDVRLNIVGESGPDDVAAAMRRAFEIEDRGWKGAAGTSVLRAPGMAEFFIRQAQTAAAWGQLELTFLECGGQPAAFAYGLTAKGVFHSMKVGYDPEYAECAPGQLLRCLLLERCFCDPQRRAVDFQGPMTDAHAAWRPERCTVSRLTVAPRRWLGRLAVGAYEHLWPAVQAITMYSSRSA